MHWFVFTKWLLIVLAHILLKLVTFGWRSRSQWKLGMYLRYAFRRFVSELLLHLHEIVKGLYFQYSLSVCVCVCVSVSECVCLCVWANLSVSEQNSSWTEAPIWTRFLLNGCLPNVSDLIEIGDLGSKVKVTVTNYPFFLHNSLLISLLGISVFLCLIKMKFSLSLRYALCRFVWWTMTSLGPHVSFLLTIIHFQFLWNQ